MIRPAALFLAASLLALPVAASAADVNVLYAGSLVNLMEHGTGDALSIAPVGRNVSGLRRRLEPPRQSDQGQAAARRRLHQRQSGGQRHADGRGERRVGEMVHRLRPVSRSSSATIPASRFAADLKTKPWYEVLREPGIRIGRTDAKLDPKGALTLQAAGARRRQVYQAARVSLKAVLGAADNPAQVQPGGEPRRPPAVGSTRRRLLLFHGDGGSQDPRRRAAAGGRAQRASTPSPSCATPPNPAGAAKLRRLSPQRGRSDYLACSMGSTSVKPTVSGEVAAVPGAIHLRMRPIR